jgi:hypothetical protein
MGYYTDIIKTMTNLVVNSVLGEPVTLLLSGTTYSDVQAVVTQRQMNWINDDGGSRQELTLTFLFVLPSGATAPKHGDKITHNEVTWTIISTQGGIYDRYRCLCAKDKNITVGAKSTRERR